MEKNPTKSEKMQDSVTVFKNSLRKMKLLELQNEASYFKSNYLRRWNTGSSSKRCSMKRLSLSLSFTASGPSVSCTLLQVFSILASSVIFWAGVFESIFGRLHLEQHCSFRDLFIRPEGLLQVPSLLNENSLLKTFLQRSIKSLNDYMQLLCLYIIVLLKHFVYGPCIF